jgi:DNA-binding NarL/FixJ family response regulator
VVERVLRTDSALATERAVRERAQALWNELSCREQAICRLAAKGLLNKQIAAAVGVAESTVQAQRAKLLRKLGMSSVAELVRLIAQVRNEG